MTRLLIGNDFSEDVRTDRGWTGWWVQRLLWFARDGDVLVLPSAPEGEFLEYVTGLTGTHPESLRFVTPRSAGQGGLTAQQLADADMVEAVHAAVAELDVTEVQSLWPDAAVAQLARRIGLAHALPGYGFVEQGGGFLVNSKSFFRAVAGGVGARIPSGAVCTSRQAAERAILDLLDLGTPVMMKHDYLSGGRGNEILSADETVRPVGARRTVRIGGQADVAAYLDDRWDWLSSGGRGRPVAEVYHRDSSAYFVEFFVTDAGARLGGDGELLSAPYAVGQVMPSVGLEDEVLREMVDSARRLASALHAIGYRGVLSPDAIVTPERDVLFTEFNGRVTGSTHIYDRIGRHVVGDGFGKDRVILERVWPEGWSVESFAAMVRRLGEAGFAYDRDSRSGVVLTNAFDGENGVMYCVVAEDLDQAWSLDSELKNVFATR
ncbi:MAG TPA: peptide ligase PGM1-related protein [Actinocrinis sp.]|uniref:preATP grasp domain-containing protein n=1 Tax=Actinocrinis sp. TaxID=1920516 RepID=UPI002DDD1C65|nr:peptide ligase PGM1-related protein [Actinocrinis sp.]HEV2343289.1 peptide ligase PGM1-related protein [Actinocrinis sp.]